MDSVLDFVGDEENTILLVGGFTAVAAMVVGGVLMNQQAIAEPVEEAPQGKLHIPHLGGRKKKTAAALRKGSGGTKAKKANVTTIKSKYDSDSSDSSSEEEQVVEAPAPAPAGKKGKKGKNAAKDTTAPIENEWATIPKKVQKPKKAKVQASGGGGEVTLDLGDAKPAVIGKKGAVIQDIQATSGAKIDMADKPSSKCTVTGSPEQVAAAVALINAIVAGRNGGAASGPSETMDVGTRVGAVIGKAGSNIKMIQSESGAKLDIDRDTSQVVISGEPDQIRKAKELIQGIVDGKDMGPPPEAQNRIETKSAGAIIGAGGVTIRKIQVDSGARVDIDKTGDIDVITISGSHAQVAKATQLVDNVLNPKYDCKDYMDVGIKGVPLVVGSKGATIKALQTSTGCKIDIENGATVVGMFGTDAAVKACRNAIQKLITDNLYEEEVECAASQVGAIIGKGGETIRKIQTESGARVNISRDDNKVVLGGAKDAVKKARTMIEALLKDSAKGPTLEKGHVVETIDLPAYAVGSIIGKGGSNIKALEADTGASIDIQRGDGDVCKVYGPKEAVTSAVEKINAILEAQKELQDAKGDKTDGESKPRQAKAQAPAAPQEETWGDSGAKGDW